MTLRFLKKIFIIFFVILGLFIIYSFYASVSFSEPTKLWRLNNEPERFASDWDISLKNRNPGFDPGTDRIMSLSLGDKEYIYFGCKKYVYKTKYVWFTQEQEHQSFNCEVYLLENGKFKKHEEVGVISTAYRLFRYGSDVYFLAHRNSDRNFNAYQSVYKLEGSNFIKIDGFGEREIGDFDLYTNSNGEWYATIHNYPKAEAYKIQNNVAIRVESPSDSRSLIFLSSEEGKWYLVDGVSTEIVHISHLYKVEGLKIKRIRRTANFEGCRIDTPPDLSGPDSKEPPITICNKKWNDNLEIVPKILGLF